MIELKPLSELQSTQRLVHGILSKTEFMPYNKEQKIIADVAEKTMGSPDLVEVTSALLSKYVCKKNEDEKDAFLENFYDHVCCYDTTKVDSSSTDEFAMSLLRDFNLSESDFFLLSTLSLFGTVPIPRPLVEIIQVMAITASSKLPNELSPLAHLTSTSLLNVCPSTVIFPTERHHSLTSHSQLHRPTNFVCSSSLTESDFYYVPQIISDAVRGCMDKKDLVFSLTAAHQSLDKFYAEYTVKGSYSALNPFMAGLAKILTDFLERHDEMESCYKEAYRTYLLYAVTGS